MRRFIRRLVALLAIVLGLGAVAIKVWLTMSGPYLEALPDYPFCQEARTALDTGSVAWSLELAEAGDCVDVEAAARREWDSLSATFSRCIDGVWTGRADDAAGLACAVASDLVVFGDVRDLTRQGLNWTRGEATDPVLIALSATGLALTLAPQFGAGTSLFKVARRAGTLSERLADSIMTLLRRGSLRPLGGLLTDAGRISLKLGPAKATRALQYADSAEELTDVARFVDAVDDPLLALRWAGKRTLRLTDDPALFTAAVKRGPPGLILAAERGGAALLARKPLLVAVAKTVYKSPEAVAALAAAVATWLLRWADWTYVAIAAAVLVIGGLIVYPSGRAGRGERDRSGGHGRGPRGGSHPRESARRPRRVWRAGQEP